MTMRKPPARHDIGAAYRSIRLWLLALACLAIAPAVQAQDVAKSVKVAPGGLYELVVNPSTNKLYVAAVGPRGEKAAQIVMLNAETLEREGSIDVAETPVFGLGINHRTQMLYGTATTTGHVVAIDLATNKIVAVIGDAGDAHVREVRVDEDANRLYVSVVGGRYGGSNEVWVIDGSNNTLLHRIAVDADMLVDVAVDAKKGRIFAVSMKTDEIVVIDADSQKVTDRWASGGERATNALYDAASNRLFVTHQNSGTLSVLDGDNGTRIASIDTGEGALDVKYDAGAGRLYVTNRKAGTLTVIDAASYDVLGQIETGTYPQTIAIDQKADRVYVSNKAKRLPRNAPPDAVPPKDPDGDTVVLIRQ